MPFQVLASTDRSAPGHGSLVLAAGPEVIPGTPASFRCFSGPGAEIPLRPKCHLQGGEVRGPNRTTSDTPGEERPWGWGWQQFCPLLGTWALLPVDLSLL